MSDTNQSRHILPIPHDKKLTTRVARHASIMKRGSTYVPWSWPRWGLAATYVDLEIEPNPRTLLLVANLAHVAALRLGGITITD